MSQNLKLKKNTYLQTFPLQCLMYVEIEQLSTSASIGIVDASLLQIKRQEKDKCFLERKNVRKKSTNTFSSQIPSSN